METLPCNCAEMMSFGERESVRIHDDEQMVDHCHTDKRQTFAYVHACNQV